MDIQFLGSGPSMKAIIYYITDYITKAQLKTHVAYAALTLAVQKLEQTDTTDDLPTIYAKKLLQKCALTMVSHQELSGQQVAFYLLDLEDHFSSHSFNPIYWTNYEHIVDKAITTLIQQIYPHDPEYNGEDRAANDDNEENMKDDIDALDGLHTEDAETDEVIVSTGISGELEIHTPCILNYIFCGPTLRSLNIWEYTSSIQKIPKKQARYNENENLYDENTNSQMYALDDDCHHCPKCDFDLTHPDYATHVQQVHHPNNRPVPVPIGPSLPRQDKAECHKKYCHLMLLLLKPWTMPQDLIQGYDTFEDAFQAFLQQNEKC